MSLCNVLLGRRRRQEHGQALPLAAIGVFVMCIGVLATVNLGQAVHQKIQLQNTADSAAYTLAAMEARTFNYIAFLNRTQIAHYNTALAVQSVITWVGFHVSVVAAASDMAKTLAEAVRFGQQFTVPCEDGGPKCIYAAVFPTTAAFATALDSVRRGLVSTYGGWHKQGHQIVQAFAIFNKDVVFPAQLARAALMNVNLLSGMQNYIEKLDDQISFLSGHSSLLNAVANAAMNSMEYYAAFDRSAGVNPQAMFVMQDYARLKQEDPVHHGFLRQSAVPQAAQTEKTRENAIRIMTEMINASRHPKFVYDRSDGVAVFEYAPGGVGPSAMANVTRKGGSSKMVSSAQISNSQVQAIRNDTTATNAGKNYNIGTHIASDDFALQANGYAVQPMAPPAFAWIGWEGRAGSIGDAIASYDRTLKHSTYEGNGSPAPYLGVYPVGGQVSMTPGSGVGRPEPLTTLNCDIGAQPPWWPGLAPFFKFATNTERTSDYGQPSTWIFLNKHHSDFQTRSGSHQSGQAPHYGNWRMQIGNQSTSLDTTIGGRRNSFLFEGINVVSRGMAYYHRPGHWAEQPNFFNPFWRARLAPIGQKLQNFWDKYVSSNITTSSQDKGAQMLVNVLRNAQMDMFTSAVTSLVTH